jgi:putative acyl-CoA dehydrogenase
MPRLYRDTPLNSIWEGSGNVNALDVLRAMARQPESVEVFVEEIEESRGSDRRLDTFADGLRADVADPEERQARALVERLALALQGSLLVRHSPPPVADAFCATRLGDAGGRAFGTLPAGVDTAAIVGRHRPRPD